MDNPVNGNFSRLNAVVTNTAFMRLKQQCELRAKNEAGRITLGNVITALAIKHLPAHPDEARGAARATVPAKSRRKAA